jgi:hypothetical protein
VLTAVYCLSEQLMIIQVNCKSSVRGFVELYPGCIEGVNLQVPSILAYYNTRIVNMNIYIYIYMSVIKSPCPCGDRGIRIVPP